MGFYPDCWKEEIGVIIKKSNRDEINSKSYKLVLLLNYLDKIAEKIVTNRLAFYIETTDLLYEDQIDYKKQRVYIPAYQIPQQIRCLA